MTTSLRDAKQRLWKIITFLIFHSGALRLVRYLADQYECQRDSSSRAVFPYIKRRRPRTVQILAYHRINDEHDPFFPATPTEVFARQMEYLAYHFSVCPLTDLIESMRKRDVPENAVALTFDDGYRDNYLNAFPILQKLSLPATIFLATGAIGSGRVLWHDKVFSAFRQTQVFSLQSLDGDASKSYSLRTLEEKLVAQSEVLRLLRSVAESERSRLIDCLITKLGVKDKTEFPDLMLTWDQVKEMRHYGISFGSHTVTHPILSTLSIDRTKMEIYESKRTIEEKLGRSAMAFAYPNGKREDFNEATKDLVREAGYICALTAIFGANTIDQDRLELRRGTPWEEDLPTFATKLHWYKLGS